MQLPVLFSGPCSEYVALSDAWRSVDAAGGLVLCDQSVLKPRQWYRLMPPAGNRIPETVRALSFHAHYCKKQYTVTTVRVVTGW